MLFSDFERVRQHFKGKRVALFGSAPTCLDNDGKWIDQFDLIVRISNFKMVGISKGIKYDYRDKVGSRTDVFYSFFGSSIRKTREELIHDGVKLCMSKLPNSKPLESKWHVANNKPEGVDYRPHYRRRQQFWFCPTYVPTDDHFLGCFEFLGKHQSTTGFSAIYDLVKCELAELYISGFTFFKPLPGQRILHNINESWREKNNTDPLKHLPGLESDKLRMYCKEYAFIKLDSFLRKSFK